MKTFTMQPESKDLREIATFVRPAQHEYLFENMRDSIQSGVASQDYPIGFKAKYPFHDYRNDLNYWLESTVVHYSQSLKTIDGDKPGLILLNTITPPWIIPFGRKSYSPDSSLYQTINQDFANGIPVDFKKVITPLLLADVDCESGLFFAPSIYEIAPSFAEREGHAADTWDYFKVEDATLCNRRVIHDHAGNSHLFCWTRSLHTSENHAWAIDQSGAVLLRSILNGANILTACAITA